MRASVLFTALLVLPTVSAAQVPCTTDARQVVNAAYLQVLERPVSRQITDPLVAQLMQGQTSVKEIVRQLAMSVDHRQRFLSVNTPAGRESAVTALYRHLLARTPDEAGLRSHADALANGDPASVIDSMIDSAEYQQAFGDATVPGGRARYCGASSYTATDRRNRFWEMDRSGNGVIERSEWTGTQASFNVHDWNADGVLAGDEVRQGARRRFNTWDDVDFDPAGGATEWTEEAFRHLDRNSDNRVTSSEWYYGPEFFVRADRNRDGTLTMAEFTGSGESAWDDDRDDRFEHLDVNRNGRVERGEWHGSLDAFQWLDRNNDSVLSRAELVGEGTTQFNGFASLDANANGTLSISEWRWSRRSFNRYDTNGDGLVSRQEFVAGGGSPTVR